MKINKVRFIEPGNLPYRKSIKNLYTYDKHIRTPSIGLLTLTTIVKEVINDTLMYSESISNIKWDDVFDADIVFIGIFTFPATRGYELAHFIKEYTNAIVVMGGLHASMNYPEAVKNCDYVLLGEGDESILEFIDSIQNGRPIDLQREIIHASAKIYSINNLLHVFLHRKWRDKVLFLGEFFWQKSVQADLKQELPNLSKTDLPNRTS